MKKIVYVLSLLFMITACNGDNTTFENNAYKLRNAKNGAEITLGFDGKDKRFFGRSAINRYFGTYKTEGDKLTFGPAGSTMMAGPGHLMAAEREYMQFLPGKPRRLNKNNETGKRQGTFPAFFCLEPYFPLCYKKTIPNDYSEINSYNYKLLKLIVMCHAAIHKVHKFGLIGCDRKIEFFDDFACIGDAVNAARGNNSCLGVIARILRTDGTVFRERIIVKNSRHQEYVRLFNGRSKHSTMNF